MSQTIDLTLDGLSCGHCVKRVKESLEQRPDVEQADVSVTEAHVTGTASAEQLIDRTFQFDQATVTNVTAGHQRTGQVDHIADANILQIFSFDRGCQDLFHNALRV